MFSRLRRPRSSARVVVQVTHRPPSPILRYIDQIVGSSSETLELRCAPGPLRRLDVDVLHVADEHLDTLIGVPRSRPVRWALGATVLVCLLRAGRIALVRRVDPSARDARPSIPTRIVQRLLDQSTTMFVGFDQTASSHHDDRFEVVPHAHFRDRFTGYPRGVQVPGRVLCLSSVQVRPHAEALVAAMQAARTPGVTGRLAGSVPADLAERLIAARARRPAQLSLRLEMLSDGAQIQEIDASELVVAPGAETLEEMQVVFLALSLDRPVLTRRTDATVRLADDVGRGWIHLYDGVVTGGDIDAALGSARVAPTLHPHLTGRELAVVRAAYADLFREAAGARRRQWRHDRG